MLLLLLSTLAFGQNPTTLYPWVPAQLDDPSALTTNGAGAPTVAWDGDQERYLMFFESQTRTKEESPNCPMGEWSIGLAYAEVDQTTYTVHDSWIVEPTPGTPWSCFAAHPAVLQQPDGTIHLWFKAGQREDTCAGLDEVDHPEWGCTTEPGIGKVIGIANVLDDEEVDEQLDSVQAQLLQLQAEREGELSALEFTLDELLGQLSDAPPLQCHNAYPDVCAPCPGLELQATAIGGNSGIDVQDFCQPFTPKVPRELDAQSDDAITAINQAFLRVSDVDFAETECRYRGNNNRYDLNAVASCDDPSPAYQVELEVLEGASAEVTARAFIVVDSTDAQHLQGADVDTLDALRAAAVSGDLSAVHAQQPQAVAALNKLHSWLNTQPPSIENAQLQADLEDAEAALNDHLARLQSLDAQQTQAEGRVETLNNSTQGASFSPASVQLPIQVWRAAHPSVAVVDDEWKMLYTHDRRIWGTSSTDGETWDPASVVVSHGFAPWNQTELLTPSLNCNAEGPARFATTYVGRTNENDRPGDTVLSLGVARSFASNFIGSWFETQNFNHQIPGSVTNHIRHLEVLAHANGSRRVWMSHLNSDTSLPEVQLAFIESLDPASPADRGRICE